MYDEFCGPRLIDSERRAGAVGRSLASCHHAQADSVDIPVPQSVCVHIMMQRRKEARGQKGMG